MHQDEKQLQPDESASADERYACFPVAGQKGKPKDTSQQVTQHNDHMNVAGAEDTSQQMTRHNDHMNVAGTEDTSWQNDWTQ